MVIPERVIEFRVPWEDDNGNIHVNTGYRVQFNGAIGPYKGGLRFAPSVNLSIMKFLGFEQTFKDSLTTLPIGGAKGGSDFDPNGKSDREVMRFCQAFMTELYRHIGPDVDVPAGDLGVGGREIGYLFGQYRKLRGAYENGVLTGKARSFGGSDFDPNGKSDREVMRFCQAFMTELYRHIGPDVDVPAGDLGVGGREIGYLFGQYRKLRGAYENGVLTGKARSFGGSLIRPEATGFGAVYYLESVMKHEHDTLEGKTVAVAGFGNVAWGVVQKLSELGAKPVTLSGPDGYIYDPDGITTKEKFDFMLEMRASGRNKVQDYADKFGCKFVAGDKPWGEKVDIIMPCATQNDVDLTQAKRIVANNIKYYIEVANMPTTNEALRFLMDQKNMVVAPSKAVNAGGVLVSALEMSQNSERISWTAKEVDDKLHQIMTEIHDGSAERAEKYGLGYNLVAGANMVGFQKVADAMMAQGIAW